MRDFLVAELRGLGRDAGPDAVFVRLREIVIEQLRVKPSARCSTPSLCATFG